MNVAIAQTVFLDSALEPLKRWLLDDKIVEICANCPGEIWVETLGVHHMERFDVPALTEYAIRHLTERVAAEARQSVNEQNPLLSGSLHTGERFQGVLPPATTNGGAFAIRKQVIKDMSLTDYQTMGSFDKMIVDTGDELTPLDIELCQLLHAKEIMQFIRLAVRECYSILLSGGTSSGKTTFLNAILKEVPAHERIITIEDTREVKPIQKNYLPLVASKGDQGESSVTIQSLLEAGMRLRPDRIFLGEIRGSEAYAYLSALNTGHSGSISTTHANSPTLAFERIALLVMQAGLGLNKTEIIDYVKSVIPIVVQHSRIGGWRGTSTVYFSKMELWRRKYPENV